MELISPYLSSEAAEQVPAAQAATSTSGGYASISDFIVTATMKEVRRLQRKYNGGKEWTPQLVGRRGLGNVPAPK